MWIRPGPNPPPPASLACTASMPPIGCATETTARLPQEGPFYSQSLASIARDKQPSQRAYFVPELLKLCSTASFDSFVCDAGLENFMFEPNPFATAGSVIHDRFVEACKSLPEIAEIAIGFHGTHKDSIPIILKEGLDPKKRKGQAYGPGEYVLVRSSLIVELSASHFTSMSSSFSRYFSTDPGVATTYTSRKNISHDDSGKMLVFLVVKPFPPVVVNNATDQVQSNAAAPSCPIDYIVVPNPKHQLPLGVLSYRRVKKEVLAHAVAMRMKLQQLHMELQLKEHRASIARLKAKIIQKIINDDLDVASEIYQKSSQCLDLAAKKEISMFAYTKYDENFVCFYFPNLPERMTAEEEDQRVSVETLDTEVQAKKMEIQAANSSKADDVTNTDTPVAYSAIAM